MKTRTWMIALTALIILIVFAACSGGRGGYTRVYGYYGHGPWWGHRSYYHDRIVVVPPGGGEPPMAVQLPEPPMDFPDMGIPEVAIEPF